MVSIAPTPVRAGNAWQKALAKDRLCLWDNNAAKSPSRARARALTRTRRRSKAALLPASARHPPAEGAHYLNGEDIAALSSAENIGIAKSAVAAHFRAAHLLLDTPVAGRQPEYPMDGRDISTVAAGTQRSSIFGPRPAPRARHLPKSWLRHRPRDRIQQRDYRQPPPPEPLKQAEDRHPQRHRPAADLAKRDFARTYLRGRLCFCIDSAHRSVLASWWRLKSSAARIEDHSALCVIAPNHIADPHLFTAITVCRPGQGGAV